MKIMFTIQNTTLPYGAITILTALWAIMAFYVFAGVKETYARNGTFTNKLLNWWFAMWGVFFSALVFSALYGVWLLPIDKTIALVSGLVLFVAGIVLLTAGLIEFRTLRRSCAQDTSKLITSGIYKWSRNPQFIGCLLYLIGISLAGRSMFAFALTTAAFVIIYWYTVRLAEPYLERLYGEEYRQYKKRTSRWFGVPAKNN
jgi:protein-S-isoprenylcysteine O-methyltransferase Ste14